MVIIDVTIRGPQGAGKTVLEELFKKAIDDHRELLAQKIPAQMVFFKVVQSRPAYSKGMKS